MIDGELVHSEEISKPQTFKDVKVYAGDSYHTAADAEYWNLKWENT